jgi:hypothetical protein
MLRRQGKGDKYRKTGKRKIGYYVTKPDAMKRHTTVKARRFDIGGRFAVSAQPHCQGTKVGFPYYGIRWNCVVLEESSNDALQSKKFSREQILLGYNQMGF